MAFSNPIWCLFPMLLIIFPTICVSGCLPQTTTTTTTTMATTVESKCECLDACAPYKDARRADCVNFCSYNEEPIPRCMCDGNYTKARGRRIRAFVVDGTPGKSDEGDCGTACDSTKSDAGPSYGWTKFDCSCVCPNFEDLVGYRMQR